MMRETKTRSRKGVRASYGFVATAMVGRDVGAVVTAARVAFL